MATTTSTIEEDADIDPRGLDNIESIQLLDEREKLTDKVRLIDKNIVRQRIRRSARDVMKNAKKDFEVAKTRKWYAMKEEELLKSRLAEATAEVGYADKAMQNARSVYRYAKKREENGGDQYDGSTLYVHYEYCGCNDCSRGKWEDITIQSWRG